MVMTMSEAMRFMGFEPGTYTKEQLTEAYRKLARKLHPDVPGGSTEQFQKLDEAYRVATGHSSTAPRWTQQRSSSDWWEEMFRRAAANAANARWEARRRAERESERRQREAEHHEGRYDYQDRSRRSRGSYVKGVSCGKGMHSWSDKGTYQKCSVCGATKSKTTRAKSSSDYRSRVSGL